MFLREHNYGESTDGQMAAHTRTVLHSLGRSVVPLAERALGSELHAYGDNSPTITLDADSSPEQFRLIMQKDPGWERRFASQGVGIIMDNIKQQDVNRLTWSNEIGDSYILTTTAAFLSFCREHNMLCPGGRYSGDERIFFFAPNNPMSAAELDKLSEDLTTYTQQYLRNSPVWEHLGPILGEIQATHGKNTRLGASYQIANLSGLRHDNTSHQRMHELLGQVFDANEGKLTNRGNAYLTRSILGALKQGEAPLDQRIVEPVLPPSIQSIYRRAVMAGANPQTAIRLAKMAAFEGLFPRSTVHRISTLHERAMILADRHVWGGGIVLGRVSLPILKYTNKEIGHSVGDKYLKEAVRQTTHLVAEHTQNHGSLVPIIPSEQYEHTAMQLAALTDWAPHGTLGLIVSTLDDIFITTDTSPNELFARIDALRTIQAVRELQVLLARAEASDASLHPLYAHLSVRMNQIGPAWNMAQSLGSRKKVLGAITKASR